MTERYQSSTLHLERARRVIPDGAQEFTRFHNPWNDDPGPRFSARSSGARIWDVDGRCYLDLMMALGPLGLGYAHPEVEAAIVEQARRQITASLPTTLEAELAERLIEVFPGAEQVRFGKSGSDVTAAAIRVARAYTKRDLVLACGYHGWHDWCLCVSDWRSDWLLGVPKAIHETVRAFPYNDLGALEQMLVEHRGQVAAVILEPVNVDPPSPGYLEGVRRLTEEHGVVLIFDDMLNAYRFALGGSAEYYSVVPDLITGCKALANGMPLSAVMGKATVMRSVQDIFFSGSFLSEALSLAAGLATHRVYRREPVVAHIWRVGERLRRATIELIEKHGLGEICYVLGYAPHFLLLFRTARGDEHRARFQRWCHERGVLFTGAHFVSFAHQDSDIDEVLQVYDDVCGLLAASL